MASSDGQATFRINVEGNAQTSTKDVASSARLAAKAIAAYEDQVKDLSSDLRRLKGNSDEINAAKATLKRRIDEARTSISSLTVALGKQGVSYRDATDALKKYGDGVGRIAKLRAGAGKVGDFLAPVTRRAGDALAPLGRKISGAIAPIGAKVSGALAPLTKKLGAIAAPVSAKLGAALAPAGRAIQRFAGGAVKAIGPIAKTASSSLSSLASAIGPAVASAAAAGAAAFAAAAVAIGAATAAVTAFGIHSADAAAKANRQREALLGNAEDASRFGDQINVLASKVSLGTGELNAMAVSLSKTRLSGKAMVDTMNAVAQASSAVDASAGAKIEEVITRGQNMGRLFLRPAAMGMADELQGTGLAFADVAEQYAAVTKKTVKDASAELQSGRAPIEAGAEAIRRATEKKFGGLNLANAFSLENAPKKFHEQLAFLSKGVDMKPLTKALAGAFEQLSPEAPLGRAVKTFMETLGGGFVDVASRSIPLVLEGFKWLMVGALRVGTLFYETKKKILDAWDAGDFVGLAKEIAKGLLLGFTGPVFNTVVDAVKNLGKEIKKAFGNEIEAHSPSKAFERFGKWTVEGYADGVDRASARAAVAVAEMAPAPAMGGSSAAGPVGPSIGSIQVTIQGAPTENAEAMKSPAFLAALTRALRDAVTMQGAGA